MTRLASDVYIISARDFYRSGYLIVSHCLGENLNVLIDIVTELSSSSWQKNQVMEIKQINNLLENSNMTPTHVILRKTKIFGLELSRQNLFYLDQGTTSVVINYWLKVWHNDTMKSIQPCPPHSLFQIRDRFDGTWQPPS